MRLLYGFMGWKQATAFVLLSELIVPAAIISAAVSRSGVIAAVRPLLPKERTMGPIEWLEAEAVGEEIVALLPRGAVTIDAALLKELQAAFGQDGEFPATLNQAEARCVIRTARPWRAPRNGLGQAAADQVHVGARIEVRG